MRPGVSEHRLAGNGWVRHGQFIPDSSNRLGPWREPSRTPCRGDAKDIAIRRAAPRRVGRLAHWSRLAASASMPGPSQVKGSQDKSRCRLRKVLSRSDKCRSGQVDRGCRTPREEERPGAPGSASATPARQRDRQRPTHVEHRRAQAVKKTFGVPWRFSSLDPSRFSSMRPCGESGAIFGAVAPPQPPSVIPGPWFKAVLIDAAG